MSEMTATRMGFLARAGALILLIAAWVVGGTRLWRTSVPSSLDVDGLDASRYFPAAVLREAHHYAVFANVNWLLATLASIAALAIVAWRAPRFARGIGLGPIGSGGIGGRVTPARTF